MRNYFSRVILTSSLSQNMHLQGLLCKYILSLKSNSHNQCKKYLVRQFLVFAMHVTLLGPMIRALHFTNTLLCLFQFCSTFCTILCTNVTLVYNIVQEVEEKILTGAPHLQLLSQCLTVNFESTVCTNSNRNTHTFLPLSLCDLLALCTIINIRLLRQFD